ncbi:McrB family protein [Abditibacterium utsteinense]|nr:AAA family ATPase [Abditibacterium utsteinense]
MPNLSPSLNQILYGPPGTGKTYNSIQKAVTIIDGKIESEAQAKQRFEELRKAGQIEFVTFHQSFSYEEFIEGLRPLIGEEGGQVSYEIRAGVLKQIALRATLSPLISARVIEKASFEFEEVWAELGKWISDNLMSSIEGLSNNSRYQLYFDNGNLLGRNIQGEKGISYRSSKNKQQQLWEGFKSKTRLNCNDIGRLMPGETASGAFIVAVFNHMKILESQMAANTMIPVQKSGSRFVLIIDEINRGNISKILGELITLLEDDKRIGMENELRLTLPTSGETFALPPNLYILGTMNTSDKSLAQLDVALRRRFDFEEMAPDLALCDKFAAQIPVLRELNRRLEWALDREHRLGHAYFMKVDSEAAFNDVFRSKILPLLLEYFPHDFGTLRAVLGEKSDGFLREMLKPDGFTSGGKKYRWWFESGAIDFSAFAQLKLNYGL